MPPCLFVVVVLVSWMPLGLVLLAKQSVQGKSP